MRSCKKGHKVMIEMQKSELVFSIKNKAYIFADTVSSNVKDPHELHNVYDVAEDGNRDELARILDASVEDCVELLFRFTKNQMNGGGFDSNEWEECIGSPTNEEDAYYIAMNVPDGFSSTSIHTMTVYIHDYIVYKSLYEWMVLVYPDGADRFNLLAEEKKKKIKDASNRSAGRARIRLHPFG